MTDSGSPNDVEYAIGLRADARTNTVVWKITSPKRAGVERLWFGGTTASLLCEAPGADGKRRIRVRSDRALGLKVLLGEESVDVSVPAEGEISLLVGRGS